MTTTICVQCSAALAPAKIRRHAKYCSVKCQKVVRHNQYRTQNRRVGIPTGTSGAVSELVASADLMRKGFAVFRALSPSCCCDLAILKDNRLWKVEVRTGYRTRNGMTSPKPKDRSFDVHAIVMHDPQEIIYRPLLRNLGMIEVTNTEIPAPN